MSMSARVSIECHWLACTGNHLTGNHHTTGCKPAALGLVEIFRFELFNYVFLDNYLCA